MSSSADIESNASTIDNTLDMSSIKHRNSKEQRSSSDEEASDG